LAPEVELYAVQYPGREDRINEPLSNDLDGLAQAIVGALLPLSEIPTAFFGHSMGAAVACQVARRLQALRPGAISLLFVSGQPAPHCRRPPRQLHLQSDDAIIAELSRLGLGAELVGAYPELRSLILPIVRGDYALDEQHHVATEPLLDCPITALLGDTDTEVNVREMLAWQDCTTANFELRIFEGGHFYLVPKREEVVDVIAQQVRIVDVPQCWASA
jgi:pyochelin biosynthetic protein PchC